MCIPALNIRDQISTWVTTQVLNLRQRERKALQRQGKPCYDKHLETGKVGVAALRLLCAARKPPLVCGKLRGPGLVRLLEAADDDLGAAAAVAEAATAGAGEQPVAKRRRKAAKKKKKKKKARPRPASDGAGGSGKRARR